MKKHIFYSIFLTSISAPSIALASGPNSFKELVSLIYTNIAGALLGFLITLALAVFFWRIVVSIYKVSNSPEEVKEGKNLLIWGVIILFVMVSLWGLTRFFSSSLGIQQGIPLLGNGYVNERKLSLPPFKVSE